MVSVFARTLERMANDESKDIFYSGDLSEDIAADLAEIGSILTIQDLRNYKAIKRETIKTDINNDQYLLPQAPASGPVLLLMLNILKDFDLSEGRRLDELTYHRIIEESGSIFEIIRILNI